ncbi:hypothetical protein L7F22_055290 [Adiantum nelumboides]|nr:hypothetical protein [Adiantum nelumboides]
MLENEQDFFSGFMENVPLSEATSAFQEVNNKKRARADMSCSKEQIRSDRVRDTVKQSELFLLKEALRSERDSLQRLYRELEEERCASMTAANEAMAMISRLQEEKAAVLVEARRYKLAADERETHNQEAIILLKEALLTKEDDLLAFHELLSAYKERLMRLEAEQGQFLDYRGDSDQMLLLEGPVAPLSGMDSNQTTSCYEHNRGKTGYWKTGNEWEAIECQDELSGLQCYRVFRHDDEKRQEGTTEGDCQSEGMFGKEGNENTFYEQLVFQSNVQRGVHNQESVELKHSQEQSLEDVSVSIFARVKRLEERFEYLRQSQQVVGHHQPNFSCQFPMSNLDNLDSEESVRTTWEATSKVPYDRNPGYCTAPEGQPAEDLANSHQREPEEVLKCLSFEKVRLNVGNEAQEQSCPGFLGGAGLEGKFREIEVNVQKAHDGRSISYMEMFDDESEGVHDVYEVQSDVKQSFVYSCSKDNTGQQKFEIGSMDASFFVMPPDVDKGPTEVGLTIPDNYAETEAGTAVVGKLSVDVSPMDGKDLRANVSDGDVQQLKLRLQALEGERDFMNEAIDSLRKENKELRILQELAQQLRELNIDVRRNEVTKLQGQPPLLNYLKGMLSFSGCRSSSSTKGNRCLLHACSFANKQRQGGLLHILNKGSESPKGASCMPVLFPISKGKVVCFTF